MSFSAIDRAIRRAIVKAKFQNVGISTHSFRRTVATRMSRTHDLPTVMKAMGWKDLSTASRYLDVDEERVKSAIHSL
jgi:integrase/recombinase XerD